MISSLGSFSRCAAGDRCRAFDRSRGSPAELEHDDLPLCEGCLEPAERDVRALLLDFRDLENLVPRSLGEWGEGGGGRERGELPVPLREGVDALQREIHWVTVCWAEVLADLDRLHDPGRRVRMGFSVQWAVGILAPRVRRLAAVPDVAVWDYPAPNYPRGASVRTGAEGLVDMSALHARARSALGLTRPAWSVPGTCPEAGCNAQALVRDVGVHGTDTVTCQVCGRARPYSDYERYVNMLTWEGVA